MSTKKTITKDFNYYTNILRKLILAGYSTDKDIAALDIEKVIIDESIKEGEIRDTLLIKNAFKSGKPVAFFSEILTGKKKEE